MAFVVTEKMIEVAGAVLWQQDLSGEPGPISCEILAEQMLRAVATLCESSINQGLAAGPSQDGL